MIKLKLLSNKIKMPFESRENILAIYSPRKHIIPEADTITVDTEINIVLPLNTILYVTKKFKGQKIKEIRGPEKKRLRITLLNQSYFQTHTIEKGSIVGYVLSPNSRISIHAEKKKHRLLRQYTPKAWDWKSFWQKKEDVGARLEDFSADRSSR